MAALVDELHKRRAEAALGGPERARERHVARGKLLPRDRVMTLRAQARRFWSSLRLRQTVFMTTPSTGQA
jgi:acetyl-CoA carboxylase carboxyltransferase component